MEDGEYGEKIKEHGDEMYDKTILKHYTGVAENEKNLDSCTMADETTRAIETQFILDSIETIIDLSSAHSGTLKLLDVGCGNGYTLTKINNKFPSLKISGIEFTPALRDLAVSRPVLKDCVKAGDIRDLNTIPPNCDIILMQRVMINLLSLKDQEAALTNLVSSINQGGYLISVEAFKSGLQNLNLARTELNLNNIPPAHHNLYLDDDFFSKNRNLEEIDTKYGENILSTHYFNTRVLHDVALASTGSNFTRNSLFVKFFDDALPLGIGEFSPLKCNVYRKV